MLRLCREKEVAALQVELDAKSAEAVGLASKVAELNEKNCEWKMLRVKHQFQITHNTCTLHTHTHTHLHVCMYTHMHVCTSLTHTFVPILIFTHDTLSTL